MGYAYTAVMIEEGYGIGRADKGTKGYTPYPQHGVFPSWDAARAKADEMNEAMGVDKAEAFAIVAGTMELR